MRKSFGVKSWFYPLPVLIIATYNADGTADAMNAAWGGLYDADKVELCLSAGHRTTANIREKGAFTVSFADAAHVVPADYELIRINEDGNVIGRIVNVSVDESVLGADGGIDFAKFRPIAFEPAHSAYHVLGEKVGDAFRDGGKLK